MVGELVDKQLAALLVLVSSVLAGCLPIAPAHKTVEVPPLEVRFHGLPPEESAALAIVRAQVPYETFVDILKSDGRLGRYPTNVGGNVAYIEFGAESRYTAVPAISFLPDDPNYGKEHTLFVHLRPGDDDLYRISIEGRKAVVRKTSLSRAQQTLPSAFEEPRGPVYRKIPKHDYYQTVKWTASDSVVVENFGRGAERDVLSVRMKGR